MITPAIGTPIDPRKLPGMLAQSPGSLRAALFTAVTSAGLALVAWIALGSYAIPIATLVGGTLVLGVIWPTPVQIGRDGVGPANDRRSWFVPFSEVDAIEQGRDFTFLRHRGGRLLLVDTRQKQLDESTVTQLHALISSCRASERRALAFPPRGDEPLPMWLERVSSASGGVDRCALLASVEDPCAPCLARSAAALLLRPGLTAHEKACIAEASATTASVPLQKLLRLCITASASASDLFSALAELDRLERAPRSVVRVIADALT